jgi:hypothetical protein
MPVVSSKELVAAITRKRNCDLPSSKLTDQKGWNL